MIDFKKVMERISFVKGNRSMLERLLKLRLEVILMDLVSLQKSMLYGFVLIGVGLVFFFISLMGIFFGLNELVVNPEMRLWIFFGSSVFFIIVFFIFIKRAVSLLVNSIKTLNTSIKDLGSEVEFVLGKSSPEKISSELENKIKKQLEQVS